MIQTTHPMTPEYVESTPVRDRVLKLMKRAHELGLSLEGEEGVDVEEGSCSAYFSAHPPTKSYDIQVFYNMRVNQEALNLNGHSDSEPLYITAATTFEIQDRKSPKTKKISVSIDTMSDFGLTELTIRAEDNGKDVLDFLVQNWGDGNETVMIDPNGKKKSDRGFRQAQPDEIQKMHELITMAENLQDQVEAAII